MPIYTYVYTHIFTYMYTYGCVAHLIHVTVSFAASSPEMCVAESCRVLQCVAVCCSVLQRVAVCCRVLPCVAH